MNQTFSHLIRGVACLGLTMLVVACGKTKASLYGYWDKGSSPLETIQSLVGTTWSQKGASKAFFEISRNSVSGDDGCNGFSQQEEGLEEGEVYFIFTPDGTIKQNGPFISTLVGCDPWPQGLSSYPCSNWKTYKLYDAKLSISTSDGSIHTFIQQ